MFALLDQRTQLADKKKKEKDRGGHSNFNFSSLLKQQEA